MNIAKDTARSELASLASRAKRLIVLGSVKGWDELSTSATSLLSRFQTASSENLANKTWFVLNVCKNSAKFIVAFNEMKVGKFYDAWCNLERVEIGIADLFRNPFYDLRTFGMYELREVVTNWQSLYPYAVFFSPEMIVKKRIAAYAKKTFIRGHSARIELAKSTEESYATGS